jgi:diguanylate cyclase (GGDEF)-like protein/PAS domain S-box-containing protein
VPDEALRIILVEDVEADAELATRELKRAGMRFTGRRVDTEEDFRRELAGFRPHVILSDFSMPRFDGMEALAIARQTDSNIPFIFVSGTIGEEYAIRALKNGAIDYVLKTNLIRLPPAVERAVRDAEVRAAARKTEEARRKIERRFQALIENSADPIVLVDADGAVLYRSPASARVLGYSDEERVGRSVLELVHPEDTPALAAALGESLRGPARPVVFQCRARHKSGGWKVFDGSLNNLSGDEAIGAVVINSRDITERREAEQRLAYLAQFDPLTGLPNRDLFQDRLEQTLAQAGRNQWLVGVVQVNLDRFKIVNDTLGHGAGDKLLVMAAERLGEAVRSGDTLARFSADEFAVALSNLARADDASVVAHKVLDALGRPFEIDGQEVYVSASLGVAVYPDDGASGDVLIKNADAAMHRVKEHGRNGFQFYLPEMNERAAQRLQLETALRGALERDEFMLHYQAKVDLASGAISGFEALLRWQQPDRRLMSPARFIPVLEDTGLIVPVGEWVMSTACKQIKTWQRQGMGSRPVSVNLSARQFLQPGLDAAVARMIEETGIDPRLLDLELTESLLMRDAEEAVRVLKNLKSYGVRIAVDDFGTGYSSLAYLKRFPLDALKVDRAFVRDVNTDPDDAAITIAIINLAHSLKLKVIAEGVETSAQLEFLREHGCDEIQGYLFSHPLAAEDCTQLLAEDRRLPAR